MKIILDTNHQCFLCLQVIPHGDRRENEEATNEMFLLGNICRFLNINPADILRQGGEKEEPGEDAEEDWIKNGKEGRGCNFSVSLCKSCGSVTRQLSALIEELEGVQGKVGYYAELFQEILERADLTGKVRDCRVIADSGGMGHLKREREEIGSDRSKNLISSKLPVVRLTRLKEETIQAWKRKCAVTPAVAGADVVTPDDFDSASPSLYGTDVTLSTSTLPVVVEGKEEIGGSDEPIADLIVNDNSIFDVVDTELPQRALEEETLNEGRDSFPIDDGLNPRGVTDWEFNSNHLNPPPIIHIDQDPAPYSTAPPTGFLGVPELNPVVAVAEVVTPLDFNGATTSLYAPSLPIATSTLPVVVVVEGVEGQFVMRGPDVPRPNLTATYHDNPTFRVLNTPSNDPPTRPLPYPSTSASNGVPGDLGDSEVPRTRNDPATTKQIQGILDNIFKDHFVDHLSVLSDRQCLLCLKGVKKSRYAMASHFIASHPEKIFWIAKPVDATEEDFRTICRALLNREFGKCEEQLVTPSEGGPVEAKYKCYICRKILADRRHLKYHVVERHLYILTRKLGGNPDNFPVHPPQPPQTGTYSLTEDNQEVGGITWPVNVNQPDPAPPVELGGVPELNAIPPVDMGQVHADAMKQHCQQLPSDTHCQCSICGEVILQPLFENHVTRNHPDKLFSLARHAHATEGVFKTICVQLLENEAAQCGVVPGRTPEGLVTSYFVYSCYLCEGTTPDRHILKDHLVLCHADVLRGKLYDLQKEFDHWLPDPGHNSSGRYRKVRAPPRKKRKRQHSGVCPHCHQSIPSKKQGGKLHTLRFHPEQLFLPFKPAHRSLSDFKDSCADILKGEAQAWSPQRPCTYCTATYRSRINYLHHLAYNHQESLGENIKALLLVQGGDPGLRYSRGETERCISWSATWEESPENGEGITLEESNMWEDNREDDRQVRAGTTEDYSDEIQEVFPVFPDPGPVSGEEIVDGIFSHLMLPSS